MTIQDVIKRIGYFRNLKGLSKRELSLMIGKHEGYINKLDSLDFNLPTRMLLEIIDALWITPAEFFCLGTEYNEESKPLFKKFNNLSAANKHTILDLIDKLQ